MIQKDIWISNETYIFFYIQLHTKINQMKTKIFDGKK